jgi:hypothetical protein
MDDENGEQKCLENAHSLDVLNGIKPLHVYIPVDNQGNTIHHTEEEERLKGLLNSWDNQLLSVRADLTSLASSLQSLNIQVDTIGGKVS